VHPFHGTFDPARSSIELVPGNARLDPAPAAVRPLRTVAEAYDALVEAGVPAPLDDPQFPVDSSSLTVLTYFEFGRPV
jgi:hypothetical protein